MRVLYLVNHSLSHLGGAERYNHQLASCMARKLGKRSVFMLPSIDDAPHRDRSLAYTVLDSVWWDGPWRARLFRRWALVAGLDVLLAYGIGNWRRAMLLGSFLRRPYVILAMGIEVWRNLPESHSEALNAAGKVIAISGFTRDRVVEKGVCPERTLVLHPHVDTQRFRPDTALKRRVVERHSLAGCRTLLTVGRLDSTQRRKGHSAVLRALPQIAKAVPSVRYIVVGDGLDRARLQRISAELGVADRVLFVGAVSDAELVGYYNACDVFIMPSELEISAERCQGEGFGIVYIEAGACGKPVVAGRGGGVPDAVQDGVTGLLVDPCDVESIARAATRLLVNHDYAKRLGRQGRKRALDEFSLEHLEGQVSSLVDRLALVAEACPALGARESIRKLL